MLSLSTLELIGTIAAIITSMIIGFLYAFDKGRKKNQETTEQAEDRLVVILQGTVTALEGKVKELEAGQKTNIEEITKLKAENEISYKILQGRDDKSEKLMAMAMENSANIAKLYSLLERHMGLVEKALNVTQSSIEQK